MKFSVNMSNRPNLKRLNCPLGGRPKNPVWANFTDISQTKVRCNKCLMMISKRVDRAKEHQNKCQAAQTSVGRLGPAKSPLPSTSAMQPKHVKQTSAVVATTESEMTSSTTPSAIAENESSILQTEDCPLSAKAPAPALNDSVTIRDSQGKESEKDASMAVQEPSRPVSRASDNYHYSSSMAVSDSDIMSTTEVIFDDEFDEDMDFQRSRELTANPTNTAKSWPISSTPLKSKSFSDQFNPPNEGTFTLVKRNPPKKAKETVSNPDYKSMTAFAQRTSEKKFQSIKSAWAQFFYKVS